MNFQWVMEYGFQTTVIALGTYLFAQLKMERVRNKATQTGVKALLKDRLISTIHKCKQQGYVYIHQLENLNSMFTEYDALGGNGAIVHMMKEISKLPTKTDL